MKKLIIGLIAVLLVFGGLVAWNQRNLPATPRPAPVVVTATPAPAPAAPAPDAASAPAAPAEVRRLDYDAIAALYPADTVAVRLGSEEFAWGEYADWLRSNGMQYEDYFEQMATIYGVPADWTGSVGDGSGRTYAENMRDETSDTLTSFMAIRSFAREHGIALDAEALEKLEPEQLALRLCGENGTVEQLAQLLENDSHMSIDAFRYYSESIALYSKCYETLYGAQGEKLSEEEIIAKLEEQGYLSAGHILFLTIDPMTGAALDEATLKEKLQKAEEIVAELRAIEDPAERLKRFNELKAEFCEDSGKLLYPDGYTFTPGTMVTEFEESLIALEPYGVSDPVKSSYGYHVILRLPLEAESLLFSVQGKPNTARVTVAQDGMTAQLDEYYRSHAPEYAEGLAELDLTKFIKE